MSRINIMMIAAAGVWITSAAAQTANSTSGKTVAGIPMSATEERRTIQILNDGTRIDKTDTDKFYRDDAGRTRIQRSDGSGMIHDSAWIAPDQSRSSGSQPQIHTLPARYDGPVTIGGTVEAVPDRSASLGDAYEEDPGTETVNGVTARGSRATATIPVGQIGNDRPIRIVTERWYSADVLMDVKTVVSDPRYGETTYQLTDIQKGPQDAALFRHPTPAQPRSVPAQLPASAAPAK